jgi:hypothetical protein
VGNRDVTITHISEPVRFSAPPAEWVGQVGSGRSRGRPWNTETDTVSMSEPLWLAESSEIDLSWGPMRRPSPPRSWALATFGPSNAAGYSRASSAWSARELAVGAQP